MKRGEGVRPHYYRDGAPPLFFTFAKIFTYFYIKTTVSACLAASTGAEQTALISGTAAKKSTIASAACWCSGVG